MCVGNVHICASIGEYGCDCVRKFIYICLNASVCFMFECACGVCVCGGGACVCGCACAESKKKDTLQSYFEPQVQKFLEWLLVTRRRSQEHFREKLKPGLLRSHQRL